MATINNFISALYNPEDFFTFLRDAEPCKEASGELILFSSNSFAEAHIALGGQRYLVSMPLNAEVATSALRRAVAVQLLRSELILDYRVLYSELGFLDARGVLRKENLLLEKCPSGRCLSECVKECDPSQLFEALGRMQSEFERLGVSHSHLDHSNVILCDDGLFRPQRLRYLSTDGFNPAAFDSLRSSIAESHGVEVPRWQQREESQNVSYGYNNVGNPFEGMCVAESSSGYGYVDSQGKELIEPKFLWAGDMREGRAEVETSQGMGLIDAEGNYIIEPRYEIVEFDPVTTTSQVRENGKWTTFDYNGCPLEKFKPRG